MGGYTFVDVDCRRGKKKDTDPASKDARGLGFRKISKVWGLFF